MAAMIPSWAKTLGAMIDGETQVRVRCSGCAEVKLFTMADLEALAAKVGRDYSLVDRRCRCRLTPGCRGWNRLYYLHGVFRPLVDRWVRDAYDCD